MSKRGNGLGSTYQDGERWVAVVSYADLEGRRRRKKRMARSEREAKVLLRQLLGDVEGGVVLDRDSTVADVIASWLPEVQEQVRPATYASYEAMARLHIVPAIGQLRARSLQPEHVRALLRDLTAGSLSPASVRYVRKVLHMALRHAEGARVVSRNVVTTVRGPSVPRTEIEPFTVEEIQQL